MIGKKSLKEIRSEVNQQLATAGINADELAVTLRSLHRKPALDKTAELALSKLATRKKRRTTLDKK